MMKYMHAHEKIMFQLNQKFCAKDDLEYFCPRDEAPFDNTENDSPSLSPPHMLGEDVNIFVKAALSCWHQTLL